MPGPALRPQTPAWRGTSRRLLGFGEARGGATAVEFAMVGIPFLAMIFGLIELGMIFLISSSLENATNNVARTIRTGQLQNGGAASATTFKTAICNGMSWMTTQCQSSLQVDVEPFANFQGTNNQGAPITNGQFNTANLKFSCGAPGSIVLVRAFYTWTLIAPGFDAALQRLSSGATVITAAAAFRNEPYTPGGAPAC